MGCGILIGYFAKQDEAREALRKLARQGFRRTAQRRQGFFVRREYRARHGAGYSIFEHNGNGIERELAVFVPVDESGGQPVKLQRLRRTTLGENRETSQMHVMINWDDEARALLAHNCYHPEYGEQVAFATITSQAESYLYLTIFRLQPNNLKLQ